MNDLDWIERDELELPDPQVVRDYYQDVANARDFADRETSRTPQKGGEAPDLSPGESDP